MRIDLLNIRNFRSLENVYLTVSELEKCTVFIGENNVGKTNIFLALDLFFSNSTQKAPQEVFKDPNKNIEIIIRFISLTNNEEGLHEKNILGIEDDYRIESKKCIIVRMLVYSPETKAKKRIEYSFAQRIKNSKKKLIDKSEYGKIFEHINGDLCWENPFGARNITEGYLPRFFYLPAIDDVSNYLTLKKEGYLGELISDIIEKITKETTAVQKVKKGLKELGKIETIGEFNKSVSEKIKRLFDLGDFQLKIGEPDFLKVLQLAYETTLTDEVETSPRLKGEGMQRALIFAILQVYAELIRTRLIAGRMSRSLIFAIEEPELYMDPQRQLLFRNALEIICNTDQIFFTTHSSYLIKIADYKNHARFIKHNIKTLVIQCPEDIYRKYETIFKNDPNKEDFDLSIRFNPEVNRIFFAKKVIVVEGLEDKAFFEATISKLKQDTLVEKLVSIVSCGGKGSIPPILCILNEFSIPYLVIYDKQQANIQENSKIENVVSQSNNTGTSFPIDPKLESFLKKHKNLKNIDWSKYFKNRGEDDHFISPFHAFKFIEEVDIKDVPPDLKEKIDSFLS